MISTFRPFTDGFHETAFQVHDWVMQQARRHFAADRARRVEITDTATFNAYRQRCRQRFLASIGGLPEQRDDLRTLETGRLQRTGYAIRKLIYQSLPGFYVPALLYVPDGLAHPAAAVLLACGHAAAGKAAPAYQQVCIDLVRAGFIVLTLDSPSQGEMVQCLDRQTHQPLVGMNTREHSYLQLPCSIVGQNIARYFLWNAIRGLDLLAGLPEVDPGRIGMTGNSGGGTLTQYVMMVDDRIQAAMPCCSLSSRESYLQTGSRAYDGEQNLFAAISDGIDYADFLCAFAPRPLRIGAAEYDFFAIEGVLETMEQARSVYRVLGAEPAIDLCLAQGQSHGFTTPLRRACVEWFARHLQGRQLAPFDDEPTPEDPAELQCTRSGQVLLEFADARSILDLTRNTWQQRRDSAPAVTRQELAAIIGDPPAGTLRERRTACSTTASGTTEHVFFFTEPGILTTAIVYLPPHRPRGGLLLLIPDGTEGQQPFAKAIQEHLADGQLVMVFDVRGTGAVRMHRRMEGNGLGFRSTEFRVASDHFLLGTSLAARRAYDVRRALQYLRARPELSGGAPVALAGHGWPAIYGLLAAAVEADLAGCTLAGLPDSWAQAFELRPPEPERISESLILPELGGRADIPDLLRLARATKVH